MCDHCDGYESRNVFVKFYKTKKRRSLELYYLCSVCGVMIVSTNLSGH